VRLSLRKKLKRKDLKLLNKNQQEEAEVVEEASLEEAAVVAIDKRDQTPHTNRSNT